MFEVLSPETHKEDRTVKLAEYNSLVTIAHDVLVEPSEPVVHVYRRGANGKFMIEPQEITGLDGRFELPAVGLTMSMAEVYETIQFDMAARVQHEAPTSSPWTR